MGHQFLIHIPLPGDFQPGLVPADGMVPSHCSLTPSCFGDQLGQFLSVLATGHILSSLVPLIMHFPLPGVLFPLGLYFTHFFGFFKPNLQCCLLREASLMPGLGET